ncbi:beta-N-acetylhexosaminidase [Prevotella sp.]|uniref:beta-N-acetylhexosaminidase n=1 Tax=Prevotella sp. TaxID=59823 RepID=UPI002647FBEA|nr:beta-N-acetylhexosaminidase [Prevotella sp.]MDN5552740.1 beta-N-acetylhexosaminidase [Prevotella sp.]
MKRIISFFCVMIVSMCVSSVYADNAEADYHVVPLPESIKISGGKPFILNASSAIVYAHGDSLLKRNAIFLAEYVKKSVGLSLVVQSHSLKSDGNIFLRIDKKINGDEAYKIEIDKHNIIVSGKTANGVFYGIQTLRKSLPIIQHAENVVMPAAMISDTPRFAYRGMMLDVARHFFPVDFVKEYIDLLALHNMNTFHWHLTDDQGWRIEIKKYPLLTKIGSIRKHTTLGRNSSLDDNTPYGGFYTQQQAREIVEYAKERYITVIPEIDMPGHMLGALAAYPELGCTGGPYQVSGNWGVFDDILCAGNEKTYQFIQDVMDELMDIFPSKYIHLGGDEAPKTRWTTCEKCQGLIKSLGIKGDKECTAENRLQGYLVSRIEKYLNQKGRKIIGWDEILEGDVQKSATIMSWRGVDGGIKASRLGHDAIMTPVSYCYFDYYQTDKTWNEPLLIGGNLNIEKTYSYQPVPDSLTATEKKHIIGVQGNLWTEYIVCPSLAEYQVLPRMAALSEVQWMQYDKKNYADFKQRLTKLLQIYKLYGYKYFVEK